MGSTPIGPTGDPCCTGSSCKPYLEAGQTLDIPVDWYCQWTDPIPYGGICGNKEGSCADGTACVDGKCGCSCTSATTATAATTTESTTTTEAAEACIPTGQLCLSMTEGSKGTCCSGSSNCSVYVAGTGYNCA